MKYNILIVDDEAPQRQILSGWLKTGNNTVYEASNVNDAVNILREKIIDIIITDFKMPDKTGIDLLREAKSVNPETQVIIVTAFGTIEKAVEAMREGAFDYLTKPIDLDELEFILKRAYERERLISENKYLKGQLNDNYKLAGIVSASKKMEDIMNLASRVSQSKASILLRGESGTGKEVLAKAIHYASQRNHQPFIAVNCAALNDNLLESEMFGHEKGSFTGADRQRRGRFELANNGTLFLDEIGDLPLPTQIKLLRVLQDSNFERVGGTQSIEVDVRIIAATSRNIEQLISEGKFREDLYYRLNVVTINIPPLRERKDDVIPLINYFLQKYSSESGKGDLSFSREAIDKLIKYSYPGNVRELENVIHHSLVLSRDNLITIEDLPEIIKYSKTEYPEIDTSTLTLPEQTDLFEKKLVLTAIEKSSGNQSAAARNLGISERNLRYKLEKWGLKKTD